MPYFSDEFVDEPDDDGGPLKGLLLGCVLSAALWAVLIGLFLLF